MKKILGLIVCALTGNMLHSQSQPMALEEWKATVGTQTLFYKNVTQTDASGFIYVAGATLNVNGKEDLLVAKYNPDGEQQWIKQFNGNANDVDFATAMFITGGYVYVTGTSVTSTVTPFTSDRIVIKYDASTGAQQWVNLYDGPAHGNDIGGDIGVNSSSEIFVTGSTATTSGVMDYLSQKINSTGTTQWTAINDYNGLMDVGMKIKINAASVDIGGVVQVNTGQYLWKIYTYDTSTGGLLATSSGSSSASAANDLTDMVKDAAGNIYLCGSITQGTQGLNYYVVKLNSTAVIQWTRNYNGSANLDDVAKGIKVDASGNVYVTGYSTTALGKDFATIKYNSSGTQQWVKTYNNANNGNDEANDLVLDASGNIYVTGYTTTSPGNPDYFTIKYDNAGTVLWNVTTDGGLTLNDKATNIALDASSNVIISGQSQTNTLGYKYLTVKYAQRNVITPTDFNGETTSQPLWYYRNNGQIRDINDALAPEVIYHTDKTNPNMYILQNGMRFVFAHVDSTASTNDTLHPIKMSYPNSNIDAKTYGLEMQDYAISYFQGPGRDFGGINGNAKLLTPDIYPNIDLMYSSNRLGIKYYYIVKPGGNPANIKIQFTGLSSFNINATTNALSINSSIGSMVFDRPTAYQLNSSNAIVAITGSTTPDWKLEPNTNYFIFNGVTFNASLPLIIEVDKGNTIASAAAIGNLIWNSYQGGNWDDSNKDLKLDRYGNLYTMAETSSANYYFPNDFATTSPIINNQATMIMKYNQFGRARRQVYIRASNGNTQGVGITIVNDSNVVIAGSTAGSLLSGPTSGANPVGSYVTTVGPSWMMKLNIGLSGILYSTRYPGALEDIASKNNGDFYVIGSAQKSVAFIQSQINSTNIPASSVTNSYSEIVSKFDKNGAPLWSSYIGVNPNTVAWKPARITIDTTTNQFFIFGTPNSYTDWIGYNNYGTFLQNTFINSSADQYIKKFNSSDSMIVSTFYGGNKEDILKDAVVLKNGDVAFVGATYSTDTANIILNPYDGSYVSKKWDNSKEKGWITKFSPTFTKKWATLYGDSLRNTEFRSVSTDTQNSSLVIGGYTEGMPNVTYGGGYNQASDALGGGAFITFNGKNGVAWATSMGVPSLNEEGINAVQFNPKNGNLVFAGGSDGNANYPWVDYLFSYFQGSNFGPGHNECNIGRFDAVYITGIHEQTNGSIINSDITLYPNPANTSTNLYFRKALLGKVNITMYNALGQVMETRVINNINDNTTLNFNTTSLTDGIYFINISTDKSTTTLKFLTFK